MSPSKELQLVFDGLDCELNRMQAALERLQEQAKRINHGHGSRIAVEAARLYGVANSMRATCRRYSPDVNPEREA